MLAARPSPRFLRVRDGVEVAGLAVFLTAACSSWGASPAPRVTPETSDSATDLSPDEESPADPGSPSSLEPAAPRVPAPASDDACSTAADCRWINVRLEDDGTCCRYRCHDAPVSHAAAQRINAECRARPESELSSLRDATADSCVRHKCNKPPPLACVAGRCVAAAAGDD